MCADAYPLVKNYINVNPNNPNRLDLRVGRVVDVKVHADAKHLYVLSLDVGEKKPRVAVSGLVEHVNLDDMAERLVVVLCNLKPSKIRGILSAGMVLCASR